MRTKLARRRKLSDQEIERFYLWLHTTPGYREVIRQRISVEQKYRRKLDQRFATRKGNDHMVVDRLGREVEGCG
jgi:hypothetical protein